LIERADRQTRSGYVAREVLPEYFLIVVV
jgi:hypothetical protein